MLKVTIFDDVVHARGENFHIPGLTVAVHAHADDAVSLCVQGGYDVVFMDYAMGPGHKDGASAVRELREAGFRGRIVAISSDPSSNEAMRVAGADDVLTKKAHLRSYLVHLGAEHLSHEGAAPASGSEHDPA